MVTTDPTLPAEEPLFAVPSRFRAFMRRNEVGFVVLAIAIGCAAGVFVAGCGFAAAWLHARLFGIGLNDHLSSVDTIDPPSRLFVPALGGLVLGLTAFLIQRWRANRPVDPIEANALHGGQMSLIDSILIAGQTVLSNGFGGSVGLEAGYTQIGSAVASRIGAAFRLRRADLRMLVGCGSAGAIAAAFGAPLTGTFYAFELIIGTYTSAGLAPIVGASIGGLLVAQALGFAQGFAGRAHVTVNVADSQLASLVVLAALCAVAGIAIMRGVTLVEAAFKKSRIPGMLQPAIGGLIVGGLAFFTPQVLSSGHGALFELFLKPDVPVRILAALILLKATASAVSLGAGFRGGLFFASLFLGAMIGRVYADVFAMLDPGFAPDAAVATVIGMGALAVAIVGGPLTMGFLALETTGDFPLTVMVLAASAVVSFFVRKTFGYSFATWRLHLRGEAVRSAHDIGWMRQLTVRRMMRADVRTVRSDMTIAAFRGEFPLGSTQRAIVVDASGRYVGMVAVPDAHLATLDATAETEDLQKLLRHQDDVLLPWMNVKEAAQLFEASESEALAVVDSPNARHVVGLLTEAHVLRRYSEELEKARRDLAGENWVRG